MSTRGAYGFRLNGEDKIIYNQYDSYPSGLEKNLIMDFRSAYRSMKKRYPIFLNRCRQNIGNMRPIIFFNDETYRKTMITEGNIFNFLTGHSTEYINSKDFLLDSLFCEWAYILNFDEELFEVYKGFNQSQQIDKGRYAATKSPVDDDYYGVTIYDRVPFANLLPSRWAKFLPVTDTRVENYFNNLEKRPSFLGLIGD